MSIIRYFKNAMVAASAALLLAPAAAQAQDIYVKANLGYGFSAATNLGVENDDKINFESFGAGFNGGLGAGYRFTDNIAVEVNVNYLMGRTIEEKGKIQGVDFTNKYQSRALMISPALVVSAGNDKTVSPYIRVGAVIGFNSVRLEQDGAIGEFWFEQDRVPISPIFGLEGEAESRVYGGVGIGGVGALGLNYNISDNIALFGEVQLLTYAYRPAKMKIETIKTDDGLLTKDMLPFTEFEYTKNTNDVKDDNNKANAIKLPFSSVGINFGVKFGF
jgi:outer membrane protein W